MLKWLTEAKKGSKLQLTKTMSYRIVHQIAELEEGLAPKCLLKRFRKMILENLFSYPFTMATHFFL